MEDQPATAVAWQTTPTAVGLVMCSWQTSCRPILAQRPGTAVPVVCPPRTRGPRAVGGDGRRTAGAGLVLCLPAEEIAERAPYMNADLALRGFSLAALNRSSSSLRVWAAATWPSAMATSICARAAST